MEVLYMDTIDELRAIENIYEVEINGVWYVEIGRASCRERV